jgi:hypothetical protein
VLELAEAAGRRALLPQPAATNASTATVREKAAVEGFTRTRE